ncbi:MAG: hypothetical protein J7L54_00500 [Elusimicrobia bacterium]|nr:hypothetical protein [Elusimicrobiota bacterium]
MTERPLKICQITNSGGWTGGINQMFLMCRQFHRMGHKVTVVSPPKSMLSEKTAKKIISLYREILEKKKR